MIERNIDKTISDKLEDTTGKIIEEKITKVGETYAADKVKNNYCHQEEEDMHIEQAEIKLRQIMQQTKNDDVVEQRERSLLHKRNSI